MDYIFMNNLFSLLRLIGEHLKTLLKKRFYRLITTEEIALKCRNTINSYEININPLI